MPHEILRGGDLPTIFAQARARFGDSAVVHAVSRLGTGLDTVFDVVVSDGTSTPARTRVALPPPAAPRRAAAAGAPMVVALVGPTGAGKTTTVAKLAGHPLVFGDRRVGIVCLDTYRVGAPEQSALLAMQVDARHAVVHDARDLAAARRALRRCDVILVDTAGRGPGREADAIRTAELLREIAPAEVHLVLPAGLDAAHARRLAGHYRAIGATHLLTSKRDEAPDADDHALLARDIGLDRRWIADGQDVPGDLHGAPPVAGTRRRAADGHAVRPEAAA